MFKRWKSPIRTVFLVIWSLLKCPKYCFVGLTVLVWRSVAGSSCKILLGDDPCDLEPEALDKASIITVLDFCPFKTLFNLVGFLLLFLSACLYKRAFIYYNPPLTPAVPACLSYSCDIITFWLDKELQLHLSVSQAACTDVYTLEVVDALVLTLGGS